MRQPDLAHELSLEWDRINRDVFGGAFLQPPTVEIADRLHHHLGEWDPSTRTIRFSKDFVSSHPWWVVLEVLKHEMAHQYASDVLGIEVEETAHGGAFQMVRERHGIDGRAGHKPTEDELRVVEKARKLLALTASPNENEAQAALAAVQKLLGRHGLTEDDVPEQDDGECGAISVGPILTGRPLHHQAVASLLAEHFRVRPIWVAIADPRTRIDGRQLELVGRCHDLAMAEYVHGWLHSTAEQLCPPGLSRKERLDFLAGVIVGHQARLRHEAATAKARAEDDSMSLVKTPSLDSRLEDYFERRYPRARAGRASRRSVTSSFFEGESAGRSLNMERPIGGASGPRLLKA